MLRETVFDKLFKELYSALLERWGDAHPAESVSVEPQVCDLEFAPDPSKPGREQELGLLGRIAAHRCLFEAFHNPPSRAAVLGCYRKQLNLYHRDALLSGGGAVPVPELWVLCAGKPRQAILDLGFHPDPEWGPGVYFNGQRYQPAWIVVIPELPGGAETLWLRLAGAKGTVLAALADLARMPATEPAVQVARKVLVQLRFEAKVSGNLEADKE